MSELNQFSLMLSINSEQAECASGGVSLTVKDSIHAMFPSAELAVKDISGMFIEFHAFAMGVPVEISVGYENAMMVCPFLVSSSEVPSNSVYGYLNGETKSKLIHESFRSQKIISESYSLVPSEIISKLAPDFGCSTVSVEDTKVIQDGPYYQPLMTQAEFIKKVLLPNSMSGANPTSPYYAFIDSDNNFKYLTFDGMYAETVSESLYYSNKFVENVSQKILAVSPFTPDLLDKATTLSIKKFKFSEGSYTDQSTDLVNNMYDDSPVYDCATVRSYIDLGFESSDDVQINKLRQNRLVATALGMDRLLVTTSFNGKLHAGATVNVSADLATGEVSESVSGKYLIESSFHTWDGDTKRGLSTFVLVRRQAVWPKTLTVVDKMFTGGVE